MLSSSVMLLWYCASLLCIPHKYLRTDILPPFQTNILLELESEERSSSLLDSVFPTVKYFGNCYLESIPLRVC